MKRIALLLAAIASLAAGAVGQPVAAAKEPAVVHTTAELAVVGAEIEQPRLAWLEPRTLQRLKRGVVKLDGSHSPVLSPNGGKVAIGSPSMGIRIADVRRMKLLRGSIARRSGWDVSPIAWPATRRLVALEWSERLGQTLIVTDPASRRVLKRISIDGYSTWARAGKLVVALGGEPESIGPARLLVVDETGATRSVQLERIQAGGVMEGSDEEPTYRMASPGLAVDPDLGHAYVVSQSALVADVDLSTLAVMYREVTRPASLFARFVDWLQPAAHAKVVNGWQRQAAWLGDGTLAVAGSEYDGGAQQPSAGLELFDLEAGTRRVLEPRASYMQASSGVLLAAGGGWDGRTETESGMGLSAYTYDGEQLWHALGDEAVWWFQVAGGYVYVAGKESYPPTVRVIDLAGGETRTLRGQLPFFITG